MEKGNRFAFTKTRIEGLPTPAPGKRPNYWDTEQPRLALRVTEKGTRTFYVVKWHAAKPEFVRLGVFPEMTVETARKEAAKALAAFHSGDNPAEVKRKLRGEPTFGEVMKGYFDHLAAKGRKRIDDTRSTYELYLGPMPDQPARPHGRKRVKPEVGVDWSKRPASRVTSVDVARLQKRITDQGKPTTANRVVEIISAAYNVALAAKPPLIDCPNPAKGVEPNKETARERHLSTEEAARFFEALDQEPEAWRDLFALALLTGQRRGNVRAMRWQDVDLAAATWTLPGVFTKAGNPIRVALTTDAIAILKRRRESASSVFVFPGGGKSGHVLNTKAAFQRVRERAKLDDFRLHDLRHTAASWLAQRGASLPIIGAALGHRDIKSTMRYAHMVIDPVRDALQAAQESFLPKAAQTPEPEPRGRARGGKVLKFRARAGRAAK